LSHGVFLAGERARRKRCEKRYRDHHLAVGDYQLLDITALGRQEDLPQPMAWVKLRDEYAR
jgi:predicted dithiol-disulfide oxidoreductase (DUF899 family)